MPEGITIIQHDTAESCAMAMWLPIVGSEADVRAGTFGGDCFDGPIEIEMSWDDFVAAVEDQGVWGFAHPDTRTINIWVGPAAASAEVLACIAHELGHLAGKADDDGMQEELRAISYEEVAVEALRLRGLLLGLEKGE